MIEGTYKHFANHQWSVGDVMIIKEDISSLEDYFKQFVREIHESSPKWLNSAIETLVELMSWGEVTRAISFSISHQRFTLNYDFHLLNHVHTWQAPPQLSCGGTCQVWTWYSWGKQCFHSWNSPKVTKWGKGTRWPSQCHTWSSKYGSLDMPYNLSLRSNSLKGVLKWLF